MHKLFFILSLIFFCSVSKGKSLHFLNSKYSGDTQLNSVEITSGISSTENGTQFDVNGIYKKSKFFLYDNPTNLVAVSTDLQSNYGKYNIKINLRPILLINNNYDKRGFSSTIIHTTNFDMNGIGLIGLKYKNIGYYKNISPALGYYYKNKDFVLDIFLPSHIRYRSHVNDNICLELFSNTGGDFVLNNKNILGTYTSIKTGIETIIFPNKKLAFSLQVGKILDGKLKNESETIKSFTGSFFEASMILRNL